MRRAVWGASIGAALWAASASPASAADPQYRRVTLVDGRILTTEILETSAVGLHMRMPQGVGVVPFDLLLDMVPISREEYESQPRWVVYFDVPEKLEADTTELLTAMSIDPQPVRMTGNEITAAMATRAAAEEPCRHQAACIAAEVAATSWKWVVTVVPAETGGLEMQAKVNRDRSSDVIRKVLDGTSRNDLWAAFHEVLGLETPSGPAPRTSVAVADPEVPPSGERPAPVVSGPVFDEAKVVGLSFVPLPGISSLAQRDLAGFGFAWAAVVPSAVLVWGAVGRSGQSGAEFYPLWIGSTYAITIVANQVTGLRSLERSRIGVSALPTPGGGAQVVVVGR